MDVTLVQGPASALTDQAARGRAATLVRLALIGCADFTRSAPLDSQFGSSFFRRSLSSPCGDYIISYRSSCYTLGNFLTEKVFFRSRTPYHSW